MRSLLCDGRGIPLALSVHPSGKNDSTTIDELCTDDIPKCATVFLDKGCDSKHIREGFLFLDVKAAIPRRHPRAGRPWNLGKRRRMVERTFSWINSFWKARLRTEKSENKYLTVFNG
jgi:hypothetical protein